MTVAMSDTEDAALRRKRASGNYSEREIERAKRRITTWLSLLPIKERIKLLHEVARADSSEELIPLVMAQRFSQVFSEIHLDAGVILVSLNGKPHLVDWKNDDRRILRTPCGKEPEYRDVERAWAAMDYFDVGVCDACEQRSLAWGLNVLHEGQGE